MLQWKGALTGSLIARRMPRGLIDRIRGPADNDLPRGVVIGKLDYPRRRRFGNDFIDDGFFSAEYGRHGAFACGNRALHAVSTKAKKLGGVGDRQGPGSGQCRIFAK